MAIHLGDLIDAQKNFPCADSIVHWAGQTLADTLFITPGVRPAGAAVGDQKRVATPADAVRDGATHLVVGRPILGAADPAAAARAIRAEMGGCGCPI